MIRLLAIPLALVLLLAGAMVWSGGGVEKRADLAFINRGDIYTLDLNQMSYMQDFRLTYAFREGLYGLAAGTYRPEPAGVTHHELSADKKVWTFHLREECKWSNGDPVTAHDYVFSWRRLLEEPGEYTYLFYCIKNAREYETSYTEGKPIDFETVGIEAVNDLMFRVTLNDPVAYFLDLVAFPPFYPRHEKSMERFKEVSADGKYSYLNDYTRPPHVVTNGPFNLVRWDFKRRLILKKSETYWDKANVKLNSIEQVINDTDLTKFLQYEAGDVDWVVEILGEIPGELRKDKKRTDLQTSPAFGTAFLTFLCREQMPASHGGGKNPLADVRVRQALAMVIDRHFIVENITRMGQLPAKTYVPPDGSLPGYTWLPGLGDSQRKERYTAEEMRALLVKPHGRDGPGLPYDLEGARQLLAEAGYPNGQGFPAMPILFNSDNAERAKIAQRLKSEWKEKLNIDVEVRQLEGKIFRERVSKKDYLIATVAWYGDYPDASTFTDKYLSTSLQNDSDYRNDKYDALCYAAQKEPDEQKRLRLLEQAEHLLNTEAPIVPMFHYVNVNLIKPRLKGVEANPRNLTVWKSMSVER